MLRGCGVQKSAVKTLFSSARLRHCPGPHGYLYHLLRSTEQQAQWLLETLQDSLLLDNPTLLPSEHLCT